MTIEQMKAEILAYKDFYGGDIPDTEAIISAKTKDDLRRILQKHDELLVLTLSDAQRHLDFFKRRIGL